MKPSFDRQSLHVRAPGDARMTDIAAFAKDEGVELPLSAIPVLTVDEWIARGAPGARARFADPVDQLVAGATLRMKSGELIELRPAPRRSVGPDLFALVFGQDGRYAQIVHADLRVVFPGTLYTSPPFRAPADPPLEPGEVRLLDAIAVALDERSGART
jgi:alkyldihydroxyacetonephosphate synthase